MAQRISRGKATIESGGMRFEMPEGEACERLRAVQHVLYLIFNEGYTASSGSSRRSRRARRMASSDRLGAVRSSPEDAV